MALSFQEDTCARVTGSQDAVLYVKHRRLCLLEVKYFVRYANFHFGGCGYLSREGTHTNQAIGRTITVPLTHVRLRQGAVPTKFPNCPAYMSREATKRKDPDSNRARMEHANLQKGVAESKEAFDRARENKFNSLSELASKLRSQKMNFWHVIEKNEASSSSRRRR
ncbi:hypothetical protein HPB48_021725 [Haemaphysalis longicornis]|uniref:Uncharacterized protein n=1 Tax=Haemaphysalis longicornis TaxID=44386 RepID=A0A9J6FN48_HAELO|nr:hypothetical protein HPB48_021725 [Haemaphysalis longicornis]